MTMNISQNGLDFIKHWEGFSATAYQDSAGVWTVGYGHTRSVNEQTLPLSEEAAEDLLREDLVIPQISVNHLITVPLTQNQYDALVSLVFNAGQLPLYKTLGTELNAGRYKLAEAEFQRWCHAGGVPVKGLLDRRMAEAELFDMPDKM